MGKRRFTHGIRNGIISLVLCLLAVVGKGQDCPFVPKYTITEVTCNGNSYDLTFTLALTTPNSTFDRWDEVYCDQGIVTPNCTSIGYLCFIVAVVPPPPEDPVCGCNGKDYLYSFCAEGDGIYDYTSGFCPTDHAVTRTITGIPSGQGATGSVNIINWSGEICYYTFEFPAFYCTTQPVCTGNPLSYSWLASIYNSANCITCPIKIYKRKYLNQDVIEVRRLSPCTPLSSNVYDCIGNLLFSYVPANAPAPSYYPSTNVTQIWDCTLQNSCTNPPAVNISGPAQVCAGSTATLTANASGGVSPYLYQWNTNATTNSIQPTTSGTYTVTVTGANACTATATRSVTVVPAIAVTNITTNNLSGTFRVQGGLPQSSGGNYTSVSMALFNNPAVTVTLTTAPFTHNEVVSFTVPQSGAYVVTVTDGAGCTGTAMITPVTCNPVSDSLELVKLYNATNGPGWVNKTNWLVPGTAISTWYGITVNGSGCVTCIDLDGNLGCSSNSVTGNNLSGNIPDFNLPNLQSLILNYNQLSGSIPNFNLPNLINLSLYRNQLSGSIPDFNLPNLESLHLYYNQLSGVIPNFNLPNLEWLWLISNQLSGSIPDFVLPNLESLDLSSNQLSGSIPDFTLPNLVRLDLSNNQLSGSIPDFTLPNLESLGLLDNQLSGSIPDFTLPNLKLLYLQNNQLSGSIPDFTLPNLKWLWLYNNQLSGSIPDFTLPNLEWLWLNSNQLSGSIPDFTLPNLESLDLYNNQLSGSIPDFTLPNLKWLHLQNNQLSGSIPDFNLPKLVRLWIRNNNLSGAPQFTTMPLMGKSSFSSDSLTLQNNHLTFEDILPNMPLINGFYNNQAKYAPQDSIFSDTLITRSPGQALTIDLGIDPSISTNLYQWYKNGQPWTPPAGNSSNSNKLIFNNLQNNDAGTYHVRVTNAGVSALTLYSRAITLAYPLASPPPEMVFVQGGTFTMGCTAEQQPDCDTDESPAHEVTLTDFYMGKYEVTQGQWESLMGYTQAQMRDLVNPASLLYGVGSTYPIYYVSWYYAAVFCNRLSEQQGYTPCYYADAGYTQVYGKSGSTWSLPNTGTVYWKPNAKGYRLPTEAEWEYAARGGNISMGYKYAGSNDVNAVAWYDANSGNTSHTIGTKAANELSLYDMSGNVYEWCYDWYSSSYYGSSPACAPLGSGLGGGRVLRGGSWYDNALLCRSAYRGEGTPTFRGYSIGFRLVLQ